MKKIVNALNNKVDQYGNIYFCDSKGLVQLKQTHLKKLKTIGTISKEGDLYIYTKTETSSQIWGLKKVPPLPPHWSVGAEILRLVDKVVYKVDGDSVHTLDIKEVKKANQRVTFPQSQEGNMCEHKIYIPCDNWKVVKL